MNNGNKVYKYIKVRMILKNLYNSIQRTKVHINLAIFALYILAYVLLLKDTLLILRLK